MEPLKFEQVEQVAAAIYGRHWQERVPVWENASDNVKSFVREQAMAAIHAYNKYFQV